MRYYKKLAIVSCILLIFFLFLFNKIFTNEMKQVNIFGNINKQELLYDIECMKQDDGGFCEIDIINTDTLYTYLFDTYNAVYISKKLSIDIPQKQLDKLTKFIKELEVTDIIVPNTYDDINRTMYYLGIVDLLNIQIDESIEKSLLDNICNLQNEYGFFYNSIKEKNEYINNTKHYDGNDPIILSAMNNVVYIIKNQNIDINESSLIQWIQNSLSKISSESIDEITISTISTIITIINELDLEIDFVPFDTINNIYMSYYENCTQKYVHPIYLCEIYKIGEFLLENNINIDYIRNSIRGLRESFLNCLKNENERNIILVYNILSLEPNILIDSQLKNEIENWLFLEVNYKGLFSHSNYTPSNITSTYYATMLLNSIDEMNYDTKKYIENYLTDDGNLDIQDLATSEVLMLMQLAQKYNVKINKSFVFNYLDTTFDRALNANLERNNDLILLLFETANMYNYQYSKNSIFSENIMSEIDNYDNGYKIFDNNDSGTITEQFVNYCVYWQMLYFIDTNRFNTINIERILEKYNTNYNLFEDKLYATSIIVSLLNRVEYSEPSFSETIIQDLNKELNEHKENNFFMYSTYNDPDFKSTVDCLNILKYIYKCY